MIKRVLCFTNPSYLSLRLKQIVCELPSQKGDAASRMIATHTIPIEDVGVVILDHKQITITQALLSALLENNCAVITTNDQHMPVGLQLPLSVNSINRSAFGSN